MSADKDVEFKLANVSSVETSQAAMGIISHIQGYPPQVQVGAIACCFFLLCERLKITPSTAYTYMTNLISRADKWRTEFKAIRMYLENEV